LGPTCIFSPLGPALEADEVGFASSGLGSSFFTSAGLASPFLGVVAAVVVPGFLGAVVAVVVGFFAGVVAVVAGFFAGVVAGFAGVTAGFAGVVAGLVVAPVVGFAGVAAGFAGVVAGLVVVPVDGFAAGFALPGLVSFAVVGLVLVSLAGGTVCACKNNMVAEKINVERMRWYVMGEKIIT